MLLKQSYISCLKELRKFRRNIKLDKDIKRGKLYFSWIKSKTEKIENEKDEYKDGKINIEEREKRKNKITEVIQINSIYRFKDMIRWANITRMKKVSILRLNFNGTIGKVDGKYLSIINEKIRLEFFE